MKICVIGLGYIGLPLAALFASKGMRVIGVDINPEIVHAVNKGEIKTREPHLKPMVKTAVSEGFLQAFLKPQAADVYIIAVPTPIDAHNSPDLKAYYNALGSIAVFLQKGNIVIIESTVPLETIKKTAEFLRQLRPELTFPLDQISSPDIALAYCPERVLPGNTIQELCNLDRIIGGLNEESAKYAATIYKIFCKGKILLTDSLTATMIKLIENTYRDVNIAFANELSILCDEMDLNVHEIIALANHHPRVNILQPGPGVGGHCIPIDPYFIVDAFPEKARLIKMSRQVNESKTEYALQTILNKAKNFKNPKIAILGISYKGNVCDIRESPAIKIIQKLSEQGNVILYVTDPYIKTLPENLREIGCIQFVSLDDALSSSDIAVILAGHDEYKALENNALTHHKILIDTVGITHTLKNNFLT